MVKELFRKSALVKLTSPEQLDRLLTIVEVKGWIVLSSLMLITVTTLIWGFTGKIPILVTGRAILIDPEGLVNVRSTERAIIERIEVKEDSLVKKGETLIVLKKLTGGSPPLIELKAPQEATVVGIGPAPGETVDFNTPLIWLQAPIKKGYPLLIYGFIPIYAGDRVKKGMRAKITLASVDSQKYGLLLGQVRNVLPYASSPDMEHLKMLPSRALQEFLVASTTPTVLVIVELLSDPTTPSGYKWSSGEGPPFLIKPGTIGTLSITLENKRPISYLLPFFSS